MIESDFKYFINSFILENIMYFIGLKASADCEECRNGIPQDHTHQCYRVGHRFHERRDLLFYFNEALSNSTDILTMDFYLADIQDTVHNNLLKLNYSEPDVTCINSKANIVSTIRSANSALWCFHQLWNSHPDPVYQLPIPVITVKSPTAANGCYIINDVATQQPAPVATQQPAPVATQQPAAVATQQPALAQPVAFTAEAIGTALNVVLNNELSPDNQVKILFENLKCSKCFVILWQKKTLNANKVNCKVNTSSFFAFFRSKK